MRGLIALAMAFLIWCRVCRQDGADDSDDSDLDDDGAAKLLEDLDNAAAQVWPACIVNT